MESIRVILKPELRRWIRPGFCRGLFGIWLFTWRRQLSPRRLPSLGVAVGAFPVIAYWGVAEGRADAFLPVVLNAYLFLIVPLFCLSSFGAMIRDELQDDTMGLLLTRPVTRAQLLMMKYLCFLFWTQWLALVNLGLLGGVGVLKDIPGVLGMMPRVAVVQGLAVMAYGALSSLFGLLNRRYMVLGIVYGFIVEFGIGRIPTNINSLAISRHLKVLLVQDPRMSEFLRLDPDGTFFAVSMIFVGTAIFLAAGALLTTFREYHSAEEMQK